MRFVKGTAAAIWTRGSFITGDFYDQIYFLEIEKKDSDSLKKTLKKEGIFYTEGEGSSKRPLVWISQKERIEVERENSLPVMPLQELITWAKELHLENILEQLERTHHVGLHAKYSEVVTNA